MNHYEILNVHRDATTAEIKKSFKQKIRQIHPDKIGEEKDETLAKEQTQMLNEAISVLTDSEKRKQYDLELESEARNVGDKYHPNEQWNRNYTDCQQNYAGETYHQHSYPQQQRSQWNNTNANFQQDYAGTTYTQPSFFSQPTPDVEILSPLHQAASQNDYYQCCNLLQSEWYELLDETMLGNTPLHIAVMRNINGNYDLLDLLMGFDKAVLNHKNKMGDTPLNCAIATGKFENAHYLLSCGAKVNTKNTLRQSPIDILCFWGKILNINQSELDILAVKLYEAMEHERKTGSSCCIM